MKIGFGKSILGLAAGLLMTACQQQQMDPLKAEYQQKAGDAVSKYAGSISRAIAASQASRGSRGIARGTSPVGGWDPFGGSLYGGSVYSGSMDAETQRCVELMNQIPRQSQYFYLRLGTLARCLDVVMNYRNPLMTYGYRNLDPYGQFAWGYDLNYARPTTYTGFPGQDYSSWNSFAGQGYYPGQYTIPSYGF